MANCSCNAKHEGQCDAANVAQRLDYQNAQLASAQRAVGGGETYINQRAAVQDVAQWAGVAKGLKEAMPAELSVRDLLIKNARELLARGRASGNLGEFAQAIALLDCAVRAGSL